MQDYPRNLDPSERIFVERETAAMNHIGIMADMLARAGAFIRSPRRSGPASDPNRARRRAAHKRERQARKAGRR